MCKHPISSLVEPLEARIAPAVIIGTGGKTATYTDVDGDLVTVTVSLGTLTTAHFTSTADGLGEQLRLIDFSGGGFEGANLTVSAKLSATGDGRVNVGTINSTGHDLGNVKVAGDLSRINAGDATADRSGLKQLSVDSFGALGIDTQPAGGSEQSNVEGGIGSLLIKGDFSGVTLLVPGAKLGVLKIGGSLIGGQNANTGLINAGVIGSIQITGDLRGGDGSYAGHITAGEIGSVTIRGSLVGGSGIGAGAISNMTGNVGPVKIGHSLTGGSGELSGSIVVTTGHISQIKIGRDLVGGSGTTSGFIQTVAGNLGALVVGGSVIGGSGQGSGGVYVKGDLGSVKITDDLVGAPDTGGIIVSDGDMKSFTLGGSVIGGNVGAMGKIGTVKIAHDLLGGTATKSGAVQANRIDSAFIGGSIIGGTGDSSGWVGTGSEGLGSISVGGSLVGGSGLGNSTGAILSVGDIGAVKIGHDLVGGSITGTDADMAGSGFIRGDGRIGSILIGGSVMTGHDTSTVGALTRNASIHAGDDIGSLTVKGSLLGNANANGDTPVTITARGQAVQGATTDVAIGKITIGGNVDHATILAGYTYLLAATNADAQIGAVKVAGSWTASSLVAGVEDTGANGFGNFLDLAIAGGNANIVSRIASITIGRFAVGTPESQVPMDHYGFVAQQIGSLKAGAQKFALTNATDNFVVGATGDLRIREVL